MRDIVKTFPGGSLDVLLGISKILFGFIPEKPKSSPCPWTRTDMELAGAIHWVTFQGTIIS
jgi:hypothetical protein